MQIEREIVTVGVSRLSQAGHFIVEIEEDSLVVYLPTKSVSEVNELVRKLAGPDALQVSRFRTARNQLVRESQHEKMMRFQLVDEQRRLFTVERWCFRSSHDGWHYLDGPACLSDLVERYAEHLGEESFFELF